MSPSKVTTGATPATDAKADVATAAQTNGTSGNEATPQDGDAAGSDDEDEPKEETTKSKAEQSNALNKLTDVVEDTQMDGDKMKEAFQMLTKQEEADKEAERKRCVVKNRVDGERRAHLWFP
jgi:hypothetical protein